MDLMHGAVGELQDRNGWSAAFVMSSGRVTKLPFWSYAENTGESLKVVTAA
jgi:hypothetical protein